jgi:hypothetical protein
VVDIKTLLPELRTLVTDLAEDLLARSTADDKVDAGLRKAFAQIEKGGRTAQAFEVWRDDYLDQVAVAWVLACVFVRFMEDNRLIDDCWLAGEGDRRKLAEGAQELFFRKHPHDTDREYFEHVFREVGKIPAAADLFAEGKTPLWALGPSGDATMKLLKYLREISAEEGHLLRSFAVKDGDTRFLGDLYQDLSEKARKKYALLQTPVFVEEFILDRTLKPALDEFGLAKVRMIDPTCGSGHFLLGGFARLFREWCKPEHTTGNERKDVQKALDGIYGVDINPFAVAIARFRLIVAATFAAGDKKFSKQGDGWKVHLATGDSLLWGCKPGWKSERVPLDRQESLFEVEPIYAVEDPAALRKILGQGYHVVVGNPPYIIVRDRSLNAAYRGLYSTCHQKYSLGVPFTQRLWELAIQPGEDNGGCGYIGQITANSFMKREFGKKLIEEFFPKIDLTHVIDTSGAYIPGHGTPTVILLGRARKPVGEAVRAVLGIKGEPATPEDASQGLVWQSIVKQIDTANAQDAFTSTADVPRTTFNAHPWSMGGGGATDLMESIEESASQALSEFADSIGITSFTLEDDVYILPWEVAGRNKISRSLLREMIVGDMLRDWSGATCDPAIFPYGSTFSPIAEDFTLPVFRYLWSFRTNLSNSKMFGGKTKVQSGLRWYEYGRLTHNKLRTPLSIALAFVATHNHFVLDQGGKVFKQSAPIIKLPAKATEDDHLALLGLLNSSTGCFWMKQTFHNKGSTVDQRGARQRTDAFEDFYEYTGTGLQRFPVPEGKPLALSRRLDEIARQLGDLAAERILKRWAKGEDLKTLIEEAGAKCGRFRGLMIALQEELDWECYRHYALLTDDLCYTGDDLPELKLGERAFEIVMARQMDKAELQTTWFVRHGSTPITEIPTHWPTAYRKLVERRIKVIETNKEIGLIEKPEYKRRWNTEPWAEQRQRALKNWLLDRLEDRRYWPGVELQSTARLADRASGDAEFMQVATLYRGRSDFDVAALVAELVEGESVPFLPVLRYKPSGLRKRAVWERTWDLQREEDRHALQHQRIKEREEAVRERLAKTFPEDRQRLETLDAELRAMCLDVKQRYAPGVAFEDGWKGTTMVAELSESGVHSPQGALALSNLISRRDAYRAAEASLNKKVQTAFAADPEARALQAEREAIPEDPEIPVPPKYATADFLKTDYWRLRGKLDVPKERWVSYPHCSTENDPSLVVAWAGWDHLQQATALIAYYDARKRDGWTPNRLTPVLAGLDQLLPWIHQWHPEIDKEFSETAGQSYQAMLEHDAHELGLTLDEVRQWTPPATPTRRRPRN